MYIDESGKQETLPSDFVIRSGQSAYTKEVTVFDIIHNGAKTTQKMNIGERIVFQQDSQVNVRK